MSRSQAHNTIGKWHERQGGGMTVTFGCGEAREVRVYGGTARDPNTTRAARKRGRKLDRSHTTADFVRMAVADCRAFGSDWRILSMSTPMSIYTDLEGRASEQATETKLVPREDHGVLASHLIGASLTAERDRRAVGL